MKAPLEFLLMLLSDPTLVKELQADSRSFCHFCSYYFLLSSVCTDLTRPRFVSQLNVGPSARSVRCSAAKVFHGPATMAERRRCRCGSVPLATALANDSHYTFNNAALTTHTHPFV